MENANRRQTLDSVGVLVVISATSHPYKLSVLDSELELKKKVISRTVVRQQCYAIVESSVVVIFFHFFVVVVNKLFLFVFICIIISISHIDIEKVQSLFSLFRELGTGLRSVKKE